MDFNHLRPETHATTTMAKYHREFGEYGDFGKQGSFGKKSRQSPNFVKVLKLIIEAICSPPCTSHSLARDKVQLTFRLFSSSSSVLQSVLGLAPLLSWAIIFSRSIRPAGSSYVIVSLCEGSLSSVAGRRDFTRDDAFFPALSVSWTKYKKVQNFTLIFLMKENKMQSGKLWRQVKQMVTLQTKNYFYLKWELETWFPSMISTDSTVNCSAGVFLLTDFQYFGLHVVFISRKSWGEEGEKILSPTPSPNLGTQRQIPRRTFIRNHYPSLLSVSSHTVTVRQVMRCIIPIRED